MSFRNFIICLSASFGVAWLAIVIVPYMKMRSLEPIPLDEPDGTSVVFIPKRAGRIADGSEVYSENGCYQCHTQLVRPTYAGNDMFRPDWGGLSDDEDRGDTRRESNAFDYAGEDYAQIGVSRLGPDLSNFGVRVTKKYALDAEITPEQWILRHLYNPRYKATKRNSVCPSFAFLFKEKNGAGVADSSEFPFTSEDGKELVPGPAAKALVSYLLSLQKDQPVPSVLDFGPEEVAPPAAPAAPAAAPAEEAPAEEAVAS